MLNDATDNFFNELEKSITMSNNASNVDANIEDDSSVLIVLNGYIPSSETMLKDYLNCLRNAGVTKLVIAGDETGIITAICSIKSVDDAFSIDKSCTVTAIEKGEKKSYPGVMFNF